MGPTGRIVRAAVIAAGTLGSAHGAAAPGAGAVGYPWTHALRPKVVCPPDDDLTPVCRASGIELVKRARLEPYDPARRMDFGERYDPARYRHCRQVRLPQDTHCEVYRLRRRELPVHFPYPGVPLPRLAARPPAPPAALLRTAPLAYFRAVCRREAGRFVYRRVRGVRGVFAMRPRVRERTYALRDHYVIADPYGYTLGETFASKAAFFLGPGRYSFFETTLYEPALYENMRRYLHPSMFRHPPPWARYVRYTGGTRRSRSDGVLKAYTAGLRSRYGYFWRDISRAEERAAGIAGGEIVVVALATNEVLAVWRGFVKSGNRQRVNWLAGYPCPMKRNDTTEIAKFIERVLEPVRRAPAPRADAYKVERVGHAPRAW